MPDKSKAGSLKYMAPEVLSGRNIAASPALDVWSLGCMLFAMVCGALPFLGKSAAEVTDKIKRADFCFPTGPMLTHHFRSLIGRMLELDYNLRITVKEIREHPWVRGESPGSSPAKESRNNPPLMLRTNVPDPQIAATINPLSCRKPLPKSKYAVDRRQSQNFRLPLIHSEIHDTAGGKKSENRMSVGGGKNLSTAKPRKIRLASTFQPARPGPGKAWRAGENPPSFMQPIGKTRKKLLESSLVGEGGRVPRRKGTVKQVIVTLLQPREKCHSAGKNVAYDEDRDKMCSVVRKGSGGLELLCKGRK